MNHGLSWKVRWEKCKLMDVFSAAPARIQKTAIEECNRYLRKRSEWFNDIDNSTKLNSYLRENQRHEIEFIAPMFFPLNLLLTIVRDARNTIEKVQRWKSLRLLFGIYPLMKSSRRRSIKVSLINYSYETFATRSHRGKCEKNLQKYDRETYVLSEICVYCRLDRLEGISKQLFDWI